MDMQVSIQVVVVRFHVNECPSGDIVGGFLILGTEPCAV